MTTRREARRLGDGKNGKDAHHHSRAVGLRSHDNRAQLSNCDQGLRFDPSGYVGRLLQSSSYAICPSVLRSMLVVPMLCGIAHCSGP